MADPKIRYDIAANIEGAPSVEQLTRKLDELSKTLDGELAADAKAAGDALKQALAGQEASVGATAMRNSVTEAAKAFRQAEADLKAYREQMGVLNNATPEMVAGEQRMVDALNNAHAVLEGKRASLQQAELALTQYGLSAKNAGSANDRLGATYQTALGAVQRLDPAYASAGAAATASADKQSSAAASVAGVWDKVKSGLTSFTPAVVVGNLITNLIGRVGEMGRAFVSANVQIDGTRRALNAIYKDAALAEKQIGFLRDVSNKAGVGFDGLSGAFKYFTASATAANIPLQVQNDLFRSVAQAGATLGLSTEQSGRALTALSQMASKGTVSMEELRGQLGESLPGALSLAAKGLGLTEQQLIKLVESGGLAARDLFPALAQSLKTMQGTNDGLQGSWERLKNAIGQVFVAVGDAGGVTVMTGALRVLGAVLGIVLVPLQGLIETLGGMGRAVGAAAASLAVLIDTSTTWDQKSTALKEIGGGLADSFSAADARIAGTARSFADLATGASQSTATLDKTTSAAIGSSAAAAQLSQSWTAFGQSMRDAAQDQARTVTNSEKLAQAAKAEGDAMVALVALRGNAIDTADAEAAAAQRTAGALGAVAQARASQLEIVRAELTAKQALIAGDESEQKARAQEIKELAEKIEKLEAESIASARAAESARNEATARQAASDATRDHTGQVQRLTQELDSARTTVMEYERLMRQGEKTADDVAAAKDRLRLTESRLKDAMSDTLQTLSAHVQAAQTDAQTTRTLLEADMARAKVAEQRARQMGDEYGIRRALLQQKEIELQIAKAEIKAAEMVAMASIAVQNAKREELMLSGQITEAKRIEIDAAIRAAEAQIQLAKARGESVKLMEEEIQKLRSGVTSIKGYEDRTRDAARTSKQATAEMAGGWNSVAGAANAAAAAAAAAAAEHQRAMAQKYGRAGQSESYSNLERGWAKDEKGNAVGAMESQESLNRRVANLFGEQFIGNKDAIDAANLKLKLDQIEKYGTSNLPGQNRWQQSVRQDYERLSAKLLGGGKTVGAGGSGASPGSTTDSGGSYVTNITLDGKKSTVRTIDAQNQQTLQDLMRRIAESGRVSI